MQRIKSPYAEAFVRMLQVYNNLILTGSSKIQSTKTDML